ncbi:MAG: hypothetical protein Q9175_005010 [Cornicularia normoerica]
MDGVSIAASIVSIATAGVQVSIKLVTLATQISTASDRISAIGNDISLTSGVLHQLGDLMTQKTTDDGISILNQHGLETTKVSATMCERIFQDVEKEVKRASEQLRRYKPGQGRMIGEKIELSTIEKAKWPFLQPKIDVLRADLRDAKSTLMLMLQVATLALSKRMADASMSTSEHQDLIRGIVALELQRREERTNSTGQQVPLSPFSSNDTSNIRIVNTMPPGKGTLNSDRNPQSYASLAQAGPNCTAENKKSRKDSSDRQGIKLLDPISISGESRSRDLETENTVKLSLTPSPGSKFPRTDGRSNVPKKEHTVDSSYLSLSSDSDNETQTNHNTELQLFLLTPIVQDLFDRIELRWFVQNTNMQPLAIREYMTKNEKAGLPSVVEMLQQLHAYEQAMVHSEAFKASGGSVLSLQRTTTDIHARHMLFKAVPGLQFVVQRQLRQPPSSNLQRHFCQAPSSNLQRNKSSRVVRNSRRQRSRPSDFASVLKPFVGKSESKEDRDSRHSFPPMELAAHSESVSARRFLNTPNELAATEPRDSMDFTVTPFALGRPQLRPPLFDRPYDEEDTAKSYHHAAPPLGRPDDEKERMDLQKKEVEVEEEQEAEAMVRGLLERYSTLFDS